MFETNSAEGKDKKDEKQNPEKAAEAKQDSSDATSNAGKYRKKSIGHKCTANYEVRTKTK